MPDTRAHPYVLEATSFPRSIATLACVAQSPKLVTPVPGIFRGCNFRAMIIVAYVPFGRAHPSPNGPRRRAGGVRRYSS